MADQPNNGAPVNAEEEAYAAAIAEARKTPEERETTTAAPVDDGAPDTRTAEERARDPSGRFAPKPEPFEGYSKLPAETRKYFDDLATREKRAQNQAAAAQRDLRKAQQPRPPAPRATTQPPAPGQRQAATPPPQPRKLDKWDEGSKEHPEFYASVEERIKATEEELGRKLTDLETRTAALDQTAQRLNQTAARVEARERVEHAKEAQAIIDADVTSDWRYHVGWKDEAGNAVPQDEQVFSPVFDAYLGSLHPKVRQLKEAQLESGDPYLIAAVLQEFDFMHEWATTGERPTRPAPGTPAAVRTEKDPRREALNDRQPRPNGGVPRNTPAPPQTRMDAEEAEFARAVSPENMQKYRAGSYRGV